MTNSDLREGFFQECDDLLEALTDGLAAIESGTGDADTVNAIFRSVHSIKGGAGAFALSDLVTFAHSFENLLDDARGGKLELAGPVLALCFRAGDYLADLVALARKGGNADQATTADLVAELDACLLTESAADAPGAAAPDAPVTFAPLGLSIALDPLGEDSVGIHPGDDQNRPLTHYISFAPKRTLYATGNDPAMLFKALEAMGELKVELDTSQLPPLGEMHWDEGYLVWSLRMTGTVSQAEIQEVFDFVSGCCELKISDSPIVGLGTAGLSQLAEKRAEPISDAASQPAMDSPESDAETLAQDGENPIRVFPGRRLTPVASSRDCIPDRSQLVAPPTGNDLASPPAANPVRATIRVDLDRVDRLINLVGELVINQAMLTQSLADVALPPGNAVDTAMGQLRQLSSELQERVMAIRAQPIKPLFQRMARIVREAAHVAGKKARIVTQGETTEVDRTVIERLADPLTHMIRNAVDHGLENPESRAAASKPTEGTIQLSAAHRSGRVVIELADDGGGVNREKVREIAISRGLIAPDKELDDDVIDNLLFMPGFSTATEISALSGRGVGMDVVKNEIQRLGGRVSLASKPGAGTTVTISLPLTLAILEGMVVEVAGEILVVPTTALQETLQARAEDIERIGAEGWFLSIRGGFVPIVDLGDRLGLNASDGNFAGRVLLLVETGSGRRAALAVDRVQDQREVVIKGLDNFFGGVPGIAAATILGSGKIALIIDTDEVVASQTIKPIPARQISARRMAHAGG